MIIVADKLAECDRENKKFLKDMANKVGGGLLLCICVVGAALGVKSTISGDSNLPQVSDGSSFYTV